MLFLKERVVSGHEIKRPTVIKSTRTELLGQFLLDSGKLSVLDKEKRDSANRKLKVTKTKP